MVNLGSKLRDLRQVMGLTQQQVAEALGLTKGYISQIEKEKVSPSMKIFEKLLDLYNISLADFFGAKEKEEVVVVSKSHEFSQTSNDELLFSVTDLVKTKSSFSVELIDIEVNGQSEIIERYVGEEFGYVLTGKVDLIYDLKRYTLEKGDSFYFPASEDHQFKNPYSKDTRIIWFKTPKR